VGASRSPGHAALSGKTSFLMAENGLQETGFYPFLMDRAAAR
jgi:hypothetical protein